MKKIKNTFNIGMIIFHVLSLITILIILYLLIQWNLENRRSKQLQETLISEADITTETATINDTKVETIGVDYTSLLSQNRDIVGWLKVNNTNINYPVVQTTNNNYYLNHAFDKSYHKAGSIFMDAKNNVENFDQNTIIYGHNRRDGSMFSSLNTTLEENWYQQFENQFISFDTIAKNTIWEIFSIYKEKTNNISLPLSFSSDTEFLNFANQVKQKSVNNFNVSLKNSDKILTLYTCGNNTSYRVIIHAKLIHEKQH